MAVTNSNEVLTILKQIDDSLKEINKANALLTAKSNGKVLINGTEVDETTFLNNCVQALRNAGVSVPTTINFDTIKKAINDEFDHIEKNKNQCEQMVKDLKDEKMKLESRKNSLESEKSSIESRINYFRSQPSAATMVSDWKKRLLEIDFELNQVNSQLSSLNIRLRVRERQLNSLESGVYSIFKEFNKNFSENDFKGAESIKTAQTSKLSGINNNDNIESKLQDALMKDLKKNMSDLEDTITDEKKLRAELVKAGYSKANKVGLWGLSYYGAQYYAKQINEFYANVIKTFYESKYKIDTALGKTSVNDRDFNDFISKVTDTINKNRRFTPRLLQNNIHESLRTRKKIDKYQAKKDDLQSRRALLKGIRLKRINKKLLRKQRYAHKHKVDRIGRNLRVSSRMLNTFSLHSITMKYANGSKISELVKKNLKLLNRKFKNVVLDEGENVYGRSR